MKEMGLDSYRTSIQWSRLLDENGEINPEGAVWYPHHHSFQEACTTQYNISIAHALAVAAYRRAVAEGSMLPDARIGMICNFSPSYTKEDPSEADLEALRMNEGLTNRWWLDLVTKGELPSDVIATLTRDLGITLPVRPGDDAVLKEAVVDWIGCNYYQPSRVQAPSASHDEWGNPLFAEPYIWPDRVMNESRGWEIYPKGIYDFGMKCKAEYPDLEWFVSENGIGIEREYLNKDPETQQVQDDYRIDFVRDHLTWVARAVAEGARCRGYHYWGLIDNWSWANAFKNRYGFIEVDLMENYERRPKKSAAWLKQVATSHVVA